MEIYLGDMAVYADIDDMYQWFRAIRELASEDLAEQTSRHAALRAFRLPTWEKHFDRVFELDLTVMPMRRTAWGGRTCEHWVGNQAEN